MESEKIKSRIIRHLDSQIVNNYSSERNQVVLGINSEILNQILEKLQIE